MNACEKKSESLLKKPDIRPDIRYPVTSGYPAGYPNPDFQNPDIRVSGIRVQNQYPVQPYYFPHLFIMYNPPALY